MGVMHYHQLDTVVDSFHTIVLRTDFITVTYNIFLSGSMHSPNSLLWLPLNTYTYCIQHHSCNTRQHPFKAFFQQWRFISFRWCCRKYTALAAAVSANVDMISFQHNNIYDGSATIALAPMHFMDNSTLRFIVTNTVYLSFFHRYALLKIFDFHCFVYHLG